MTGQDSLITILGHMGALPRQLATELDARCRHCDLGEGKICGDCPSDQLGIRLVMAQGYVTQEQVDAAKQIQIRLRSKSDQDTLEAVTAIAVCSKRATRRSSQRLYATAHKVAMKSNPRGYPAIKAKGH